MKNRPIRIRAAALALFALTQPACSQAWPEADLLIRNATLISPERAAPLENAWVSVSDGRITALGTGIPRTMPRSTAAIWSNSPAASCSTASPQS